MNGVFPTSYQGISTCQTARTIQADSFFTYPAHPQLILNETWGLRQAPSSDPGGLHFIPEALIANLEVKDYIQQFFPDLGLWRCEDLDRGNRSRDVVIHRLKDSVQVSSRAPDSEERFSEYRTSNIKMLYAISQFKPNNLASTALYLTQTITSYDSGKSTIAFNNENPSSHDLPEGAAYRWRSFIRVSYGAAVTEETATLPTSKIEQAKPANEEQDHRKQTSSLADWKDTRANSAYMGERTDVPETQDHEVLQAQTTIAALDHPGSSILDNNQVLGMVSESQNVVDDKIVIPDSFVNADEGPLESQAKSQVSREIIVTYLPPGIDKKPIVNTPVTGLEVDRQLNAGGQDQHRWDDPPLKPGEILTINNAPSIDVFRLLSSSDEIFLTKALTNPVHQPLITPGPILRYNEQILTSNDQGEYDLNGQTLVPGGPTITINSFGEKHAVVLQTYNGQTALAVDASRTVLPLRPIQEPAITVDEQQIKANDQGRYIIGGQTLKLEGPPITIISGSSTRPIDLPNFGGKPVLVKSLNTDILLQESTPSPTITFNGQIFYLDNRGNLLTGSETIEPNGGLVTIHSGQSTHVVELKDFGSNAALVVDGSSTTLEQLPTLGTAAPAVTLLGQTFSTNENGQYIVDDETLTTGRAPRLIGSGDATHLVGIVTSGTNTILAVDSSSTILSQMATFDTAKPAITFNGQTLSTNVQGQHIFQSQTLTPGGAPITVPGSPSYVIGLQTSDGKTILVVDSSSTILDQSTTDAPAITFADHTFTADSKGRYVIDDKTLSPGGVVSIFGTPISLAPDGDEVLIGTSTEVLSEIATYTSLAGAMPSQTRDKPSKGAAERRLMFSIGNWTMLFVGWFLWAMRAF